MEEEGITVVMTRRDDRGLYDEGSKSKQVQDLQRRCELIHDTARTVTQTAASGGPRSFTTRLQFRADSWRKAFRLP